MKLILRGRVLVNSSSDKRTDRQDTMTVYIGVDFHPYEQSVAYVDDGDGEIGYRRFLHSDKQSIKAFYRKCGGDAVIGTEATGSLWWFEKLLAGVGLTPLLLRPASG